MRMIRLLLCISIITLTIGCESNNSLNNSSIVGSNNSLVENNNNSVAVYNDIISKIDTATYDEIDWLSSEPTGGVIVYDRYKYQDVDNDGMDELFIIRKYVNTEKTIFNSINSFDSLSDLNNYAIRNGFISESYKIIDDKAEWLLVDNEPARTEAFGGGHFGTYYFLLNNGKIAKFYNSYWNETLVIYNNLEKETIITFDGDMETGKWEWNVDGMRASKNKVKSIIEQNMKN